MLDGETIGSGAPAQCKECGLRPEPQVVHSSAGYYIGTCCDCGPYSRESEYYRTREEAEDAWMWRNRLRGGRP